MITSIMRIILILNIGFCYLKAGTIDDHEIYEASNLFDYNLCNDEDGLNWACFVPGDCVNNVSPNPLSLWPQGEKGIEKCRAVLAIQQHSDRSVSEKVWRVVMQIQEHNEKIDIEHGVKFFHGDQMSLECKPNSRMVSVNGYGTIRNVKRIHDKTQDLNTFMCEFTIKFVDHLTKSDEPTGFMWHERNGNGYVKAGLATSFVYSSVNEKVKCALDSLQYIPTPARKHWLEIRVCTDVNMDRTEIKCPDPGLTLAVQSRDNGPYETPKIFKCDSKRHDFYVISENNNYHRGAFNYRCHMTMSPYDISKAIRESVDRGEVNIQYYPIKKAEE